MRMISPTETAVLTRLLCIDFAGVDELRVQARHITGVEPTCRCGCPSITPAVDREQAPPATGMETTQPVELAEVERADGVPRTVLLFVRDGYLAYIECVYYDQSRNEWPEPSNCLTMSRDGMGNVVAARLPAGAVVRPHTTGDAWVKIDAAPDGAWGLTTFSGYRETYDHDGNLLDRHFTK